MAKKSLAYNAETDTYYGGTPFSITVTGHKKKPYWVSASTKLLQPSELIAPFSLVGEAINKVPVVGPAFNEYVVPVLSLGNWVAGSGNPYQGAEIRANDERQLGAYLPLDFFGPKIIKSFVPTRQGVLNGLLTVVANTPITKRALNYAMHTTDAGDPTPYILRDLGIKKYGDYHSNGTTTKEVADFLKNKNRDKTKLKNVIKYIAFGTNKDVLGESGGIASHDYSFPSGGTFNTRPSSGFIGPKEAVLFGKTMTAGKKLNTKDYGIHEKYISNHPDQMPRAVYSTEMPYRYGLRSVEDDHIINTIDDVVSSSDDGMSIKIPQNIGTGNTINSGWYDAGGHLILVGKGVDGKYYMRGLDLYKFAAEDYAKKHLSYGDKSFDYSTWQLQHPWLNFGLLTVQKAVKPILVRSKWTSVDDIMNSYYVPRLVKLQLDKVVTDDMWK